ncbi:N-acetylglucosamine-6-phosphate deacetylase, partial [Enterococcus faecalis]
MENVIHDIYKAKRDIKGAKVPGVFLEGPFFSEKYKGAQNNEYFNHPYTSYFENLTKDEIGLIKKIAIAPELKYTEAFIDYCLYNNFVVGLG